MTSHSAAALGDGEEGNRLGPRSWKDLAQLPKHIEKIYKFF